MRWKMVKNIVFPFLENINQEEITKYITSLKMY